MRTLLMMILAAAPAAAQLADLQPGRNFPTALQEFGGGRSENIDAGDIDNDGDLDVAVANGGDGSAQDNWLYINASGAQGGVPGTFLDETATRLAGAPPETSRDIEFVDFDGDFDLDLFEVNRGTSNPATWPVNRAYVNNGGWQQGSPGYYSEFTDSFWGTLTSIPLSQEVGAQDGFGPFVWAACKEADFADLDDDGDLDLLMACPGANLNGTAESLIFLNDGSGTFHELWPWANPGADIKLHTIDFDLVDLDGDFDIDLVGSSRDSQSRVYRNNLVDGAWPDVPFTDMTQTAIIDTGATQLNNNCYEVEFADVDGDSDFDLWFVDYHNFQERVLRNNGDFTFTKVAEGIKGENSMQEYEVDFLDYDNDGDLDAFLANFSGTNPLYQNGLAQGLSLSSGLFHRSGTTSDGSLSAAPEGPLSGNGGTSLDADCLDMDGDGDTDILLSNDGNQMNRYWENVLGVPDTHGPVIDAVTHQVNKTDGSDTPIRAKVLDNAAHYVIAYHDAQLIYSVDGGLETCVRMVAQGSQQFRGVIPGGLSGSIAYRVEVTDGAGNVGVSSTTTYNQSGGSAPLWQQLHCGTPGALGTPYLVISGSQIPGETVTVNLADGAPTAFALLFVSLASTPLPFKGGMLHTIPIAAELTLGTDAAGQVVLSAPWPAGLPVGTQHWWQAGLQDGSSFFGATLSNAVIGVQP